MKFGRKMNQDVSGNKKNDGKLEICNKTEDGTGRLTVREDDVCKTWKTILRICIMGILQSKLQSVYVVLIVLEVVTILGVRASK